jgi:uncharacterized protein with HEPN domain
MVDRIYWRLTDMRTAIDQIKNLLDGKQVSVLTSDPPTRAAFERFLEILSEASRHIPEESKNEFSNIQWRQVADLGNFIRHAYHKIDLEVLWSIYENDLHSLELVVDALISRLAAPESQ